MAAKFIFVLAFFLLSLTNAVPIHTPQLDTSSSTDVNATFPESDNYPENSYDGYLATAGNYEEPGFMITFIPKTKMATNLAAGIISKIAVYTLGAFTSLSTLAIGFSILCTFTSVCFNYQMWVAGMGENDGMRSLIKSDTLNAAEDTVSEAIDKFKKIQRALNSNY
ncbi:PREDICTED: uncharacterized protein LOC108568997 [Nicrophorus vespilloides]|uniref:Uncharacterized protein LOC108568997 n=1 Tax=Nicrophorus vespilloides TaxID=110193 RepID=A0ABM1NGA4_NICVS|nr:PREDICTED: uncharacterized protein LOC108568997 [Nicrophorus vespilloides]XP_017785854.1 PREDICTED: uncharacterized protein LOC108568997 [Nicrophorus vespilloides]